MATDKFSTFARGLTAPASDAFDITADDNTDFATTARAIYVGRTGDVALVTLEGTTVTFVGLQAGTVLPVSTARVRATGTTASDLIGLV